MQNFLDPAILFFVFGLLAGALKSNLEIPPPIARFLSLYLLMALGLKGGFALAKSGLTPEVATSLGGALLLALGIPALGYALLQRWVSRFDAAAIAATYGSVSAVTFITATQYLDHQGLAFGGHMAAAMALMESPAIVMAVLLANLARRREGRAATGHGLRAVLHESLTDGAQLLLLGAMGVGLLSGAAGAAAMKPFAGDLFKGMLAFFLLEMGLLVARQLRESRADLSLFIMGFALAMPVVNATVAMGLAWLFGLPKGDALLLMVLAASASYIVVPAIVRYAIPEARAGIYFTMSLGFTFPFNIVVGIPLYFAMVGLIWN